MTARCAIWARVSGSDQRAENQTQQLQEWADRESYDVATVIQFEDSAWANGGSGKGAEFDRKRAELLEGARLKHYTVVLTWGLDRVSRRGTEDLFAFIRQLTATGCTLRSKNDPWVESVRDPFAQQLLLGVFATVAQFESQRRSERIKAGLARRKREGKHVGGRKPGAKDRKPRTVGTGEAAGWSPERSARQAERNRQRARARQQEGTADGHGQDG